MKAECFTKTYVLEISWLFLYTRRRWELPPPLGAVAWQAGATSPPGGCRDGTREDGMEVLKTHVLEISWLFLYTRRRWELWRDKLARQDGATNPPACCRDGTGEGGVGVPKTYVLLKHVYLTGVIDLGSSG